MLLAYYCDTQKQLSKESGKFIGKQLCQSPLLNKVAGGRLIEKRLQHSVFEELFRKIALKINFFFTFDFDSSKVKLYFSIIGLFLLFKSGFHIIEPRHVDASSNRTKQWLYWQSIHASMNIMKIRNLIMLFLKIVLFNQGSLTFLV